MSSLSTEAVSSHFSFDMTYITIIITCANHLCYFTAETSARGESVVKALSQERSPPPGIYVRVRPQLPPGKPRLPLDAIWHCWLLPGKAKCRGEDPNSTLSSRS